MKLTMNVSPKNGCHSYSECLDILATAGFDAVDFMLNDLVFDSSEMYRSDHRTYAENIRQEAVRRGLTVEQTHAPFQFKNWDDPEHFEKVIFPRFITSLEMSAIMGAKISVFHPLHYKTYRGNEEEMFRRNMDLFRRLIPYCKEYNVKIGIENMWRKDDRRKCIVTDTCNTATEFIRYIDTLDSEYIVACLDLGHVGLPAREDAAQDTIRLLGHDRLRALHVHDNDYQTDGHLLPYLGKMNWSQITQALADIRYQGDLTYEVNSALLNPTDESFTPIAAKFMADVGRHLIGQIEIKQGK